MTPTIKHRLDGLACLVCGRESSVLIPIPGVETEYSSQVFRCQGCKANEDEARNMVELFEKRLARGES